MYTTSLLLATALLSAVNAAPRPDVNPWCKDIPVNPVAGQIGAQYLTVPGCSGGGGGTTGTQPGQNQPGQNQPSPAVSPSVPSASPLASTGTGSGTGTGTGSTTGTGATQKDAKSGIQQPASFLTTGSSSTTGDNANNASMSDLTSGSGSGGDLSRTFSASITRYGQGPDGTPGTDNSCQHNQGACGNNPISGYTAAASVFLYVNGATGVGGDASAGVPGKACGTCWRITGSTDCSHAPMNIKPVVVLITNECAAAPPGEPKNLCGMSSFDDHDSNGNEVLIDLCMDSGASRGFWGPPPWGCSIGSATQVDCSEWCGTFADGRKSGPAGCSAPGETYEIVDKSHNTS